MASVTSRGGKHREVLLSEKDENFFYLLYDMKIMIAFNRVLGRKINLSFRLEYDITKKGLVVCLRRVKNLLFGNCVSHKAIIEPTLEILMRKICFEVFMTMGSLKIGLKYLKIILKLTEFIFYSI